MTDTRLTVDWAAREVRIKEVESDLGRIRWIVKFNDYNSVSGEYPMAFTLASDQQVDVTIQPVDAKGNPARIDGVPSWESSDETIVTVAPTEDGLGATVASVGPAGMAQINVHVDADLGEGVRELVGMREFEVVAGEAVAVNIVPGEPTPQAVNIVPEEPQPLA